MNIPIKHIPSWVTGILISIPAFYLLFGDNLWNLAETQLDGSGDGFKNYFSFGYSLKYGDGWHFDGMLYPYGDLATYADAQPLFVWILHGLSFLGLKLDGNILLLFNLLPVFSFVLAFIFICKILKTYGLQFYPAWIVAFVCLMLSPQMFRLQSHSALSHLFVFPIGWYLLIRLKQVAWAIPLLLFVVFSLISGFIHPYYVPLLCIFSLACFAVRSIQFRSVQSKYLIAGVIPILLFYALLNGLDPASGRPVNPYGIQVYTTTFNDLLPFYGWINQILQPIFSTTGQWTEGYTYPGAMLFIIPILYIIKIYNVFDFNQVKLQNNSNFHSEFKLDFFASLLMLAFASGIHLLAGDWMVNVLTPLKQFRSLGRFSWAFYYVFFIYSSVWAWQFIQQMEKRIWKFAVVSAILFFWILDVQGYTKVIRQSIEQYKSGNLLEHQDQVLRLLEESGRQHDEFQALFTLPTSTTGAEKLSINEHWHVKLSAYPFAFQTGLPLTSSYMSRVPIPRILKIVQMAGSPYTDKAIRNDLPGDKPLLVLVPIEEEKNFESLLELGQLINRNQVISLYMLETSKLEVQESISRQDISQAVLIQYNSGNNLFQRDSFYYYNDFEIEHSPVSLLSSGSLYIQSGARKIDIPIPSGKDSIQMELSFWYYIQAEKTNTPYFELKFWGTKNELLHSESFRDWDFSRVEVYDSWVRLLRKINLSPEVDKVTFIAHGEELKLDKLLLKVPGISVYQVLQEDGKIYYNHLIATLSQE